MAFFDDIFDDTSVPKGGIKLVDIQNTILSGARANKYRVFYPLEDGTQSRSVDILCTASSMPGQTLTTTEVMLKGRKFRMAAEYDDEGTWSMTISNTEDHSLRQLFIDQLNDIHNYNTPAYLPGGVFLRPNIPINVGARPWYMQDVVVEQLDHIGDISASVTLHNCFVSGVSNIEYGDEQVNTITTSEITFTFSGVSKNDTSENNFERLSNIINT